MGIVHCTSKLIPKKLRNGELFRICYVARFCLSFELHALFASFSGIGPPLQVNCMALLKTSPLFYEGATDVV